VRQYICIRLCLNLGCSTHLAPAWHFGGWLSGFFAWLLIAKRLGFTADLGSRIATDLGSRILAALLLISEAALLLISAAALLPISGAALQLLISEAALLLLILEATLLPTSEAALLLISEAALLLVLEAALLLFSEAALRKCPVSRSRRKSEAALLLISRTKQFLQKTPPLVLVGSLDPGPLLAAQPTLAASCHMCCHVHDVSPRSDLRQ
jgi:hypothetical protein